MAKGGAKAPKSDGKFSLGLENRPVVKRSLYWGAIVAIWGLIFFSAVIAAFAWDLPDTSTLDKPVSQNSITYLDRSGALIAEHGAQGGPQVKVEDLPPYVSQAFVAIEDRRFYHHFGVDPVGITRAFFRNVRAHRLVQGGSTITQQLARNLWLSPDQNIKRKIQEAILAVELEMKYHNKNAILSLYLNRVYFGAGAYGIEAASQRYFNKNAKDLSVAEAALLAGMMKGPSRYNPLSDQERAARRADVVLHEMESMGVITPQQHADAIATKVKVFTTLASQHASYFVDWLEIQVHALIPQQIKDDLIVETTLDLPVQSAAEQAVVQMVDRDQNKGVQQAALVALDGEGRIRAFVGGTNYADSQFDRAIDAHRQAGSSWKPFVYLAAMEAGYKPADPVKDEPVTINGWTPENYTRKYMGDITLKIALANSINTVAARLADQVGRDKVAAVARRLGISGDINTLPSMALGTNEVTPLEMAQAYAAFSNGGYRTVGYGVERIRTASGKVLFERRRDDGRVQVIANPPLSEMNEMLREVVASGSGKGANIPPYDIAGKTGTTSDFKDAWFVGFTGGFVTAVWVGRDDDTPMKKITGAATPAAIWKSFMSKALPRLRVTAIPAGPDAPAVADPIGDALKGLDLPGSGTATAPQPDDRLPPH